MGMYVWIGEVVWVVMHFHGVFYGSTMKIRFALYLEFSDYHLVLGMLTIE